MRRSAIQNLLLCALLTACGGSDEPVIPDVDAATDGSSGDDVLTDAPGDDVATPDVIGDVDADARQDVDAVEDATSDVVDDVLVDARQDIDAVEDATSDVVDDVLVDAVNDVGTTDSGAPDDTPSTDADAGVEDVAVLFNGVLRGRVTAALSLETAPIAGATVRVGELETVTDSNGDFELTGLPVGVEFTLQVAVEAPGAFFSTMTRKLTLQPDADGWQSVELLRGCGATVSTASSAGVILLSECGSLDSAIGLTLPTNGVVNASGTPVDNVLVKMAVLPVDVAPGAAVAGMNSFPGDMSAVSADGAESFIESFGAVEVRLFDAATGEPLQLAEGATATLEFSAAPSIANAVLDANEELTSIAAWYFDENLGVWVEEGEARLSIAPFSRRLIFTMEVSHFTWWNADRVAERTCVTGRVVVAGGTALVNQQVSARGVDYLGVTATMTNSEGVFTLLARASSQIDLLGQANVLGVWTGVSTRRLVTGAAGTECLNIGDFVLDTSAADACVRGRLLTPQGAPLSRAEITAFTGRLGSTVRADDTGSFCVPAPAGQTAYLRVNGELDGARFVGTVASFVAEAGSGTCGGATCLGLGELVVPQLGCVAGTVFFESGAASNAFVAVSSGAEAEYDRSAVDGSWCVEMEPSSAYDVYARGESLVGSQSAQLTGLSFLPSGGSCAAPGTCQQVELVLGDVGCVSGVVLNDRGEPVNGARVAATSQSGGRVTTTTSGADGRFCARALAGDSVLLQMESFEPGTRFSGTTVVTTSSVAATCGGTGCADAGNVTLGAESFSTCITGRLSDGGRPFERPVGIALGSVSLSVLPDRTGEFCANVPVNDVVTVRDLGAATACARPREVEVSLADSAPGSCSDTRGCLDIGEVDFADFCFSS